VPAWFEDAKLGIFIHWGPYSVPAWANPVRHLHGAPTDLEINPYAEWYQNALRFPGSPTRLHHVKTYGPEFSYYDFGPIFRRESAKMDPAVWAGLIKASGARYTVLTTKHHDGFTLWPSCHKNPKRSEWFSARDLVGELAQAIRKEGLRFGTYYSGILDWSFQPRPFKTVLDGVLNPPSSLEYARYCHAQFMELIHRYRPDVLWNDIGYPLLGRPKHLLANYYNQVPEGVTNDRWFAWWVPSGSIAYPVMRVALKMAEAVSPALHKLIHDKAQNEVEPLLGDFVTPEYAQFDHTVSYKWETCRGIGSSFGFNQNEDDSYMLTGDELIRSFVDIVSKNGNLLLNIGPRADGSIPENQQKPLLELGAWLRTNGEAVYGSRPWKRAQASSMEGNDIRFTKKDNNLFVFIMDPDPAKSITIPGISLKADSRVKLLSDQRDLVWSNTEAGLRLSLPEIFNDAPVHVAKLKLHELGV
jgi:alpha-L-fucosidase